MKYFNKQRKLLQIFIALVMLFHGITVSADLDYLSQEFPINKDIDNRPQYVEKEYIVKYKDSVSQYDKIKIYNQENIDLIESLDETNVDKVKIKSSFFIKSKLQRLERNSKIECIEPNYLYYPMEITSSEPKFNELWGLENIGQDIRGTSGISNIDIDILNAWEYTKGSEDVVVAVIDTGIDTAHPDLRNNIWHNSDEKLDGIDTDANGYVDDIHGWDFLHDDNSVYDYEDGDHHGTHIAGIIAASINDLGVVGVAPNIKIMPLKFLGTNDYGETVGTLSDVLKAIDYAKDKGVKIVNASWGNYQHSQLLEDAIANSGMLFLAASGNETIDTDVKPSYPANFDLPNIISVGAVGNRGEYADFSNYGKSSVHVAAPGVDILSTIPLSRYKSAAIYSKGTNYKSLFHAFGLETLNIEEDRLNIMDKTLSTLGVSQENSILLVQDDESSNSKYKDSLEYYKIPLNELGFANFDIHNVNQHDNGPSFDKMKNYDLVIWFTGEGFGTFNGSITTITKNDQESLISYLENGGKLYLSGSDSGEKIEQTMLFTDYLNVEFKSEIDEKVGLWKNIIIGEAGTSFEQSSYITKDTIYADIISPLNNGKVVMVYGSSNTFYNSYMYMGGTSMATPYVSGIAALLYSLGEEDILSIKSLIMRGTKPIEGIENKVLTGGMVNATRSISKYLNGQVNYVKGIDLGIDNLELDNKILSEYTFTPNIIPLDANDKRVKWISSDEDVVVVENGRVKAIGKGEAIITAITMDGGYIDRCKVVVKEYAYPVAVSNTNFDGQHLVVNLKKISEDVRATIIVQAYDENHRPLKLMYTEADILKDSYEFDFGNTNKPIEYINVFIWDNLDNMKPLADKKIININDK